MRDFYRLDCIGLLFVGISITQVSAVGEQRIRVSYPCALLYGWAFKLVSDQQVLHSILYWRDTMDFDILDLFRTSTDWFVGRQADETLMMNMKVCSKSQKVCSSFVRTTDLFLLLLSESIIFRFYIRYN